MWRTLGRSPGAEAELVSVRTDLIRSTSRALILTIGAFYLGCHLIASDMWPMRIGMSPLLPRSALCAILWGLAAVAQPAATRGPTEPTAEGTPGHMDSAQDNDLAPRSRLNPALALFPAAHLALETHASTLSIMWPLLAARFGLGYGAVGALGLLFRGFVALPQLPFAAVSDRHGSRWLGIAGLAWMALGMSLIGLAPRVWVLVALLIVAPLGSAAFHPAGTAYMSKALPRRRGTAVALFMIGGSLGSSLGPVVGAWLFERHGLTASPWLVPLGLIVAVGMLAWVPREPGAAGRPRGVSEKPAPIPAALWLLMAATVMISWVEVALVQYLPLLLTGRGFPLSTAGQVLFAYSALAAAGNLAGGALSDRMPRWQVMAMAQVLAIPLYVGTLLLGGHWALLMPATLGFVVAINYPVSVAMGQELMPERMGMATALTMGISWVIGAVGATLTGVLADRSGMQTALLVNAGLPLVGVACLFAVYRLGRRTPVVQPA